MFNGFSFIVEMNDQKALDILADFENKNYFDKDIKEFLDENGVDFYILSPRVQDKIMNFLDC